MCDCTSRLWLEPSTRLAATGFIILPIRLVRATGPTDEIGGGDPAGPHPRAVSLASRHRAKRLNLRRIRRRRLPNRSNACGLGLFGPGLLGIRFLFGVIAEDGCRLHSSGQLRSRDRGTSATITVRAFFAAPAVRAVSRGFGSPLCELSGSFSTPLEFDTANVARLPGADTGGITTGKGITMATQGTVKMVQRREGFRLHRA
jgi:hypothetical protein